MKQVWNPVKSLSTCNSLKSPIKYICCGTLLAWRPPFPPLPKVMNAVLFPTLESETARIPLYMYTSRGERTFLTPPPPPPHYFISEQKEKDQPKKSRTLNSYLKSLMSEIKQPCGSMQIKLH